MLANACLRFTVLWHLLHPHSRRFSSRLPAAGRSCVR